jgi:hypothetical protein
MMKLYPGAGVLGTTLLPSNDDDNNNFPGRTRTKIMVSQAPQLMEHTCNYAYPLSPALILYLFKLKAHVP